MKFKIETTVIQPFTYKPPLVELENNDELKIRYSKKNYSYCFIKKITFLNLVCRDYNDHMVSFEPLDYINLFLMSHHIEDDKEDSEQLSKALIHYFSYLISQQKKWDEEYDHDLYEEGIDEPRPTWDYFDSAKSKRITYKYRKALKESVLNDPNGLARTTASNYIRAVTKFYSFHIRSGHQFNNPPFEHEIIPIHFKANGKTMAPYGKKMVHTTDLRLNFPKSKLNDGGMVENYRRDLRPLSYSEWAEVEKVLVNEKRVVKSINGQKKSCKLSDEYSLFFLICRYTGMRREEVASLHIEQILKPRTIVVKERERFLSPIIRIGIGGKYGSLTKTVTGGNKSRITIMPSSLMQKLYEYTCSDRYKKRLLKFKAYCKEQKKLGNFNIFESIDSIDEEKSYLFIQQSGLPLFRSLASINARWSEIRNTVNIRLDTPMTSSPHNLRATFAIELFRLLLKKMDSDSALAHVSDVLGHEDIKTTLLYMKIAENEPTGDEIYEDVLDWIGTFGVEGFSNNNEAHHE